MNNKKKGIIAVGLAALLGAGYLLIREPKKTETPKPTPVVVKPSPTPEPQEPETEAQRPQLQAKASKKSPRPALVTAAPTIAAHWPGEKLGTFTIPSGLMVIVTSNPEPRVRDGLNCPTIIFAPCWRDVNGQRWQFSKCFKGVEQPADQYGVKYRFEPEASCAWQRARG